MIADNSTSDLGDGEPNLESGDWHVYETAEGDVAMALVCALADLEETDPCDLGFTLAEYVDPEALNLLFNGNRGSDRFDARVHLRIADYEAYVTAAGKILIRP